MFPTFSAFKLTSLLVLDGFGMFWEIVTVPSGGCEVYPTSHTYKVGSRLVSGIVPGISNLRPLVLSTLDAFLARSQCAGFYLVPNVDTHDYMSKHLNPAKWIVSHSESPAFLLVPNWAPTGPVRHIPTSFRSGGGSSTPIGGVGSSGTGTPLAGIGTPIGGIGAQGKIYRNSLGFDRRYGVR